MLSSILAFLLGTVWATPKPAPAQRAEGRVRAFLESQAGEAGGALVPPYQALRVSARLVGQVKPDSQEPVVGKEQAKLVAALAARVRDNGCGAEAFKEAKRVLKITLGQSSVKILERLEKVKVAVDIVPKGKKLTDLENWKFLKGRKTFDGRLWDDVRGAGGTVLKDGTVVLAAAEENMTTPKGSWYAKNYLLVHEYAHVVEDHGLDDVQRAEVVKIYEESMRRKEKTGLGSYADTSAAEMFGQAVAAYFGVDDEVVDSAALKTANPQAHALVARLYGPERSAR